MGDSTDSYYERIEHYSPERVAPFNKANREYPEARETERRLVVDLLDIEPDATIVDTNAGGGYLAEALRARLPDARIVCVDPAESFAASIDDSFERVIAPLHEMPFDSRSVDAVTNLVGLHHLSDKPAFYREAFRILAPGGLVVFGDAAVDTPAARWLNGPVDRLSDIGHDGMFLDPDGVVRDLEEAGFEGAEATYRAFTWDFPDEPFMARFCKDLFRISRASVDDVRAALHDTLEIELDDKGARMGWGLLYVRAWKPRP